MGNGNARCQAQTGKESGAVRRQATARDLEDPPEVGPAAAIQEDLSAAMNTPNNML